MVVRHHLTRRAEPPRAPHAVAAANDLDFVGVTAIVQTPEVLASLTVSGGRLPERRDASAVLPIDFEVLRNVIDPAPTNSFAEAPSTTAERPVACARAPGFAATA